MSEHGQPQTCSRCGALLDAGMLGGLCPRCLMALNVSPQTEPAADAAGPNGTQRIRPSPASAPAPDEITRLFPQFEILECLGQGGMGAVYKARQPRLDRFVALKILLPERRGDGPFTERFAREARALARLNHPDIVAVYDFGEAGGYPYLVMEYVDGVSLRQLLQRGKLAPEAALGIVPKICEALQFAHQQGVVHRDIKPENILLDRQGQVKIADFGIARLLVPGVQDRSLTGGQDIVGTPHYMAPEQVERPTTVDHRADIFSLGVVFYEMLTGELPLGKFPPPSRRVVVDARLDDVVLRALEKEPERRYQHASDVKTAVESIRQTPQPSPSTAGPAPAQDWRRLIAVVGVRDGKPVVHWPGVARSSVLLVTLFLAGAVLHQRLTRYPGSLLDRLPFLFAMVLGTAAWAFYRSRHLRPSDRRISLESSPAAPAGRSPAGLAALWSARILATLWGLLFLIVFIAEGSPPVAAQSTEVQMAFAALGIMLAGAAIGWRNDGWAASLLLGGWALFHIAEGRVPGWSFFHPGAAAGLLFGLAWIARRPGLDEATFRSRRLTAAVGMAGLAVLVGAGLLLKRDSGQPPGSDPTPAAVPADPAAAPPAVSAAPVLVPPQDAVSPGAGMSQRPLLMRVALLPPLTAGQIESYLEQNKRTAESLLAAYRVGTNRLHLEEAASRFPQDPDVQYAVIAAGAFPEARREWINAYQASSPDNALAWYFSALEAFQGGRTEQAIQELDEASRKLGFRAELAPTLQAVEEMHVSAGRAADEGKAAAFQAVAQAPHLGPMRELAKAVQHAAQQCRLRSDADSAVSLARMGLALGHDLSAGGGSQTLISQLVGLGIQRMFLQDLDPGLKLDVSGASVADVAGTVEHHQAALKDLARSMAGLTGSLTDTEMATYLERVKLYGEESALTWLQNKHGQP